ncbi:MAG: VWA domain-containing protein [Burkholderiaceae bacterium]
MRSRFVDNVVHFSRVLRDAGLPVGTERTLAALRALRIVGLDDRERVHAALSAVLIDRHEHQPLFDQAFAAFWRDPKWLERLMLATLPRIEGRSPAPEARRPRRLDEALSARPTAQPAAPRAGRNGDGDEIDLDMAMTFSERERLRATDFESMSSAEYREALRLAARLPLMLEPVRLRRQRPSARGRIDLRAMLRASARDPAGTTLRHRRACRRPPPLVILCDISGSMQRYSRIFLHWAHALTRTAARVETLTMGTRLTRISRLLRERDVDEALAAAGRRVADWAGGTRLGPCLRAFNRDWARRLLVGNATVLLLTDGLDRDDAGELAREARRLRGYARRVVWLNPLLRFDGFEPRAAGVRALLPHVDAFVPAHDLNSLADLSARLRDPDAFARTRAFQAAAVAHGRERTRAGHPPDPVSR